MECSIHLQGIVVHQPARFLFVISAFEQSPQVLEIIKTAFACQIFSRQNCKLFSITQTQCTVLLPTRMTCALDIIHGMPVTKPRIFSFQTIFQSSGCARKILMMHIEH